MSFRIGQGYDVHALVKGRPLIIGGVTIPHAKGLAGHSDADVLLHAIADACLGAAALGDIGNHFPDADERWRGANSLKLLSYVVERVYAAGFKPVNVDATIIAQQPKMAPHIETMRENIAKSVGVAIGAVNVKATTTEKLGFVGGEEGIEAQAVVLITSA